MDALMLPLNWQRVRLGDIAEIIGGGTPSTQITSFWNGSINWFTPTEIGITKYVYKSQRTITPLGLKKSSAKLLPIGTILLTSRASIGDCAILKVAATTNQGFQSLIPLEKINNEFLYYLMLTLKNKLLKLASGSTFLEVSPNKIKNLLIPLPPLNEQIAIANVLSDVDRYLYSLDALILKKESVKKALSFELLSQRKRLKGFNQAWQRVRLGDIGITISGLAGKTKQDFINGNAKYITFLNVLNNVIIDTSILENVKIYPNEKQNSFKKYDLFFNTSSETPKEVGMCAVLLDDIDQVFLNSFCFGFRIFDKAVDSLFLSYLINSEIGRKAFENLAQGSTRYNLSKSGFNNVCLILPPLNEQIAIANILSALDSEIISLKNKKRQFENIKKALNHDLMSAKIRVLNK
ncbi:restriction endonuclease subunit S [Helicobacter pylori]|uniref:restriction endonuclease subunit S n=1 Tax=Helicobacter pylori TaxID=210 RepID=UPI0018D1E717|nr:restriction endonuclease subunit S [Helicobacter pylori]MBH0264936.1 restriction endonuclease subunit S [Helicobacter pylori]MBH0265799.1 restriction endonuclease subunit S [Helicobacter pylori]